MRIIRVLDNGDVYVEVIDDEEVVIVSMKNRYMKRGIVDEHGFKQVDDDTYVSDT